MTYAVGAVAARAGQRASVLARGGFGRSSARGSTAGMNWGEVAGYSFAPSRQTPPRNGSASTPRYTIMGGLRQAKGRNGPGNRVECFSDGHRYGEVVARLVLSDYELLSTTEASGERHLPSLPQRPFWGRASIAVDASE